MRASGIQVLARWVWVFVGMVVALDPEAVPSFRRQTGLECTARHVSRPELTTVGRNFKLNGYTLGDGPLLPIAGMIQASYTKTKDTTPAARFPRDDSLVLQQTSIFLSGKISEHFGVFSQYTYDGRAHHAAIDNTEFRFADSIGSGDQRIVYGATLHNTPTLQDVWNTTLAFRFPFSSSPVAITSNDAPLIDGGLAQEVVGLGGYVWWHKTVCAEVSAYRNASRIFRWLSEGTDTSTPALSGYSPFWRLAISRDWDEGRQSAMLGTFGAVFDQYADPAVSTTPGDRFKDSAIDAQYQYVTDEHRVSMQTSLIHERRDDRASFPTCAAANPTPDLDEFNFKATYDYDRKYGINVATSRPTAVPIPCVTEPIPSRVAQMGAQTLVAGLRN